MATKPIAENRACRKCGIEKPLDEFYNRKRDPGGKSVTCRACDSANSKRWYHANRDRMRKKRREWDAANRERVNEIARQFRKRHPEKVVEQNRKRYERLKAEDRERLRQERRASKAARRAREKGATGSFSAKDVAAMMNAQRGCCWYCSKRVPDLEVEHRIPLSRGGTNDPSNLVLACSPCNKRKMTKMPWEMEIARLL